jgi:hypothetical protein
MRIETTGIARPGQTGIPPRSGARQTFAGDALAAMSKGDAPSLSDVVGLASSLGMSASRLGAFLNHGGRLSLSASASGEIAAQDATAESLRGLPLGPSGAPDFERIIADGGTVTGALPGGYASITGVDQFRQTTYYAAEVTTGDGSPARYVKGMVIDSDGKDSSAGSYVYLTNALRFLQDLPNNIEEARRRAFQDPDSGLRSSIDTRA